MKKTFPDMLQINVWTKSSSFAQEEDKCTLACLICVELNELILTTEAFDC